MYFGASCLHLAVPMNIDDCLFFSAADQFGSYYQFSLYDSLEHYVANKLYNAVEH